MSSSGGSDAADVRVICGPTAAGKSAVAIWLATQAPVTIVSADSRQLYRRFDLGTAKPAPEERRRVPHEGIDIVEPIERFSAAAWGAAAAGWLESAAAAGRTPLVVGGTGFYLRALFDGLFEQPELDASRRLALQVALAGRGTEELRRWVSALDPARAHLGRTQLLRAIEIALLTGRRVSELHREAAPGPWRAGRPRYLVVDPGQALARRIEARLDAMLATGWIDEVRALEALVPDEAPAWKATGYRVLRRHVRGELDLPAARHLILVETRQYAKRQRTWFRNQLRGADVTRLDPLAPNWEEIVMRWWVRAQEPADRA